MEREGGEGVGRAIGVADALGAAQHTTRLVQAGLDLVGHLLLPVGARACRSCRLLDNEEREANHGRLESGVAGARLKHRRET